MASFTHHAAAHQASRWQAARVDQLIGRRLLPSPSNLKRVLYIPFHDNDTLHLPLYDVSQIYWDTVTDIPIGSSLYTVKLISLRKPRGDGTDAEVAYLVNFDRLPGERNVVRVQRRVPAQSLQDADVQA